MNNGNSWSSLLTPEHAPLDKGKVICTAKYSTNSIRYKESLSGGLGQDLLRMVGQEDGGGRWAPDIKVGFKRDFDKGMSYIIYKRRYSLNKGI
jgi:hypothetical protein